MYHLYHLSRFYKGQSLEIKVFQKYLKVIVLYDTITHTINSYYGMSKCTIPPNHTMIPCFHTMVQLYLYHTIIPYHIPYHHTILYFTVCPFLIVVKYFSNSVTRYTILLNLRELLSAAVGLKIGFDRLIAFQVIHLLYVQQKTYHSNKICIFML